MTDRTFYSPSLALLLGKKSLSFIEKLVPRSVYDVIYQAVFSSYKTCLRLFYFRKVITSAVSFQKKRYQKAVSVWKVMPFSLVGSQGLEATYDAVTRVCDQKVPGDIIECGVARGGSAALMALALRNAKETRNIFLFDSYEGLPKPTEDDFAEGKTGEHLRPLPEGACLGKLDEVRNLLFQYFKFSAKHIYFIKGWFENTVPEKRDQLNQIAVLRLDGDWYSSTKVCLENLYPKVARGGVVIIDDYGTCFGAKKAVDEYLLERGLSRDILKADGRGGCFFEVP